MGNLVALSAEQIRTIKLALIKTKPAGWFEIVDHLDRAYRQSMKEQTQFCNEIARRFERHPIADELRRKVPA